MSSMRCSRNDVVLLPIPFTDLNSSKVRPAIVVGLGSFPGDLFVVPITSQAFNCDAESLRFHGACKVAEQPNSATASAVVVVRTLRSG